MFKKIFAISFSILLISSALHARPKFHNYQAGEVQFGDVNDIVYIKGASVTIDAGVIYSSSTQLHIGTTTLHGAFVTNGWWISGDGDPEGIGVDSNGNVGIGTLAPSEDLEIYRQAAAYLRLRSYSDAAPGYDAVLQLGSKNNAGVPDDAWYMGLDGDDASANPKLKFGFVAGNWGAPGDGDLVTITKTGLVGLSTTTPVNVLDVKGAACIGTGYAGSKTAPSNGLIVEGYLGVGKVTPDACLHVNSEIGSNAEVHVSDKDCAHSFTTLTGTNTFAEITPIDSTAGGALLAGYSDSDAQALILRGSIGVTDPTDTKPAVEVRCAKLNGTTVGALGNAETAFQVANHDGTTDFITVLGNGYVGILDATPSFALDVNGTIRATGSVKASSFTATKTYTPANNYNLATKKYVDDNAGGAGLERVSQVASGYLRNNITEYAGKNKGYLHLIAPCDITVDKYHIALASNSLQTPMWGIYVSSMSVQTPFKHFVESFTCVQTSTFTLNSSEWSWQEGDHLFIECTRIFNGTGTPSDLSVSVEAK